MVDAVSKALSDVPMFNILMAFGVVLFTAWLYKKHLDKAAADKVASQESTAKEEDAVVDLDSLPAELVEKILEMLDIESVVMALRTCKRFDSLLQRRLDEVVPKVRKLFEKPFNLAGDLFQKTELDLARRMIGVMGCKVLAQALGALPRLEELRLDGNQIGDEGCKALAEHLPTSLERLFLGNNQIGDEGCKALAEHLPTSLQGLDLSSNQIGDEGCKALAEHLPTSLKGLYLKWNRIGDEGCKALAEHLPTRLKGLDMDSVCVEHPTLKAACAERGVKLR